jgi:hypothetical protein
MLFFVLRPLHIYAGVKEGNENICVPMRPRGLILPKLITENPCATLMCGLDVLRLKKGGGKYGKENSCRFFGGHVFALCIFICPGQTNSIGGIPHRVSMMTIGKTAHCTGGIPLSGGLTNTGNVD